MKVWYYDYMYMGTSHYTRYNVIQWGTQLILALYLELLMY